MLLGHVTHTSVILCLCAGFILQPSLTANAQRSGQGGRHVCTLETHSQYLVVIDTTIIYAVLNIFTSYRCMNAWRIEDVGDNDR